MQASVLVWAVAPNRLLAWTLRSVLLQTLPPTDYEIVVIDGGQAPADGRSLTVGTWQVVSDAVAGSAVSIRYLYEPGGYPLALAAGLRAASAPAFVLETGDIVAPDWLEQSLALHETALAPTGATNEAPGVALP